MNPLGPAASTVKGGKGWEEFSGASLRRRSVFYVAPTGYVRAT